ncbi:hypothetical protein [Actinomadura alba]|uniref:hypothetical protein n=1 Tax=Actinomadura alba TaxID=406431 RepID=UPI001FE64AAB|nr:hypothetical protein [Actinomadura alba]
MELGTERSSHEESAEAYWRRRAIALTGVLATVGLVAWGCSGGGDAGKERSIHNAAGLSTPSPVSTMSVPVATPTITVTATAKVTMRPSVQARAGDACAPEDVVINLDSKADAYRGKARPQFLVSVVNTGKRPCTFGVGPKELELRVTSGPDRIWSSAHCARGDGSSIRLLKRGIPYAATVTWDRKRSTNGCDGSRSLARPGTYVVAVKPDHQRPRREVFRLSP